MQVGLAFGGEGLESRAAQPGAQIIPSFSRCSGPVGPVVVDVTGALLGGKMEKMLLPGHWSCGRG